MSQQYSGRHERGQNFLIDHVVARRIAELANRTPGPLVEWGTGDGAITVELAGVLTVGTLTVVDAELFPDQTVWSGFGAGYGYVPLVLPVLGLAWLWHTRPDRAETGEGTG